MIKINNKVKQNLNAWSVLSFIFIMLIILPNLNILGGIFSPANENWQHIKTFLLQDYIINTLKLVVFAGIFTILLGTSLSWLISAFDFPLRNFFKWSLVLSLAIPPYIAAYTYNGLLNYTGIIQTFLRSTLHLQINQKYFDIMSEKGAIFIFTMCLFPYVYTITQAFLEKQSAALIENARILGRSPLEIFFYIIIPVSRAAIVGGTSLVILEVLNDYGVVKYFGIPTFSTAIFQTWFAFGDIDSAIRLSAVLLLMVFVILFLEKILRGRKKFSFTTTKIRPITRQKLIGIKGMIAFSYCLIVFSLGFLIPTLQLIYWSLLTYEKILNAKFLSLLANTVFISLLAAGLIVIIAVVIANYCRISGGTAAKIYSKVTTLGYSIPGAVIAIAVIVFFINLDHRLYWLYKFLNPETGKLILSTSLVMLTFAYVIRFLAIGFNSIESGFEKNGVGFFEASRTLGMNITETFWKIDLPMIKPAVISGFLLVFVDILKELPLTLILRPFNFDTLATKAFEYANDEMIHEASIASLFIIAVSIIAIYFFYKTGDKEAK
ncbi:MAG: iron ABC transporter [Clostridiaceae bacterium BRH_c20a]|nr:MAG: iron ABC transporter [Clostridiaceae bacterium BRH_c20a]